MLGVAFGTALAGWLGEAFGWRSIFIGLAGFFVLIAATLGLEVRTNPLVAHRAGARPIAQSLARMPGLLSDRGVRALLVTVFIEGLLLFGALAFVALGLQRRYGVGPGLAGTLMTAYAVGGLVYASVARRAVAHLGERGLVVLGGFALAVGYFGLAFSPWPALATLCIGAVGSGYYMMHTTLQTHATQVASEDRGSAVALFATFLFLGQAVGVWLAARVVDAAGVAPVFVTAAVGLAALGVSIRMRLRTASSFSRSAS